MPHEPLHLPNVAYASDKGTIKAPSGDIPITDVSAHLSRAGEIIIEGIIGVGHPDANNCDISFQDDNGWNYIGEKFSIFQESVSIAAGNDLSSFNAAFKAKGRKLICKRGKISSSDQVNIYKIIANINFAGDVRIPGLSEFAVKFTTDELKPLVLFKTNIPKVPHSVGYFEVVDTYRNYIDVWAQTFYNLSELFEFAASNVINFPVTFIKNSQGDELIELTSYIAEGGYGSSIFYLSYPGELSRMVDSTYTNFVSLRDILGFEKTMLNYVDMKNHRYVESAFLHGCVLVAGLAFFFAKNMRKYAQNGDVTTKSDGSRYSLNELVEEMYGYFNITNFDLNFIKYYNEILNRGGIYSVSFEEILSEKIKLETVIEHLLLNILRFEGLYWDRSSKQWTEYKSATK